MNRFNDHAGTALIHLELMAKDAPNAQIEAFVQLAIANLIEATNKADRATEISDEEPCEVHISSNGDY